MRGTAWSFPACMANMTLPLICTRKSRRIGPRMAVAVRYVAEHPGCNMQAVAKHVAPYGTGIKYGYRTVHRAIKAGLILATLSKGQYTLRLPE